MRHLLSTIMVVALFSFIFVTYHNTTKASSALTTDVAKDKDNEDEKYYGDTLYEYDGNTIVYDYSYEWDERPSSIFTSAIITYRGTNPIDTCRVIGNGTWIVNGDYLNFAIGVDTISYPFRNLHDSVNPERELLASKFEVKKHTFHFSFELTDSSRNCDYSFEAYLPTNHPQWVNQFISTTIRNDIQAIFLDNKGSERLINEYLGIVKKPKKIKGINAYAMSPKQIAKHFASEFEKHYRNDFPIEEYDGMAPKYDYSFTMSPAWSSSDGKLITYRFYIFYYTSGMHGYMEEYYLTFDNATGRMLGRNDIFSPSGFDGAISILEKKLCDHRNTYTTCDGPYPAYLEKSELEANASEIIKEVKDSVYFPRPALTNSGVVFSYQPYEMGAFCEGILHFPISYKDIRLKVSR